MSKFKVGDKVLQGDYLSEWEVLAVKNDWYWIYREGYSNSGDLRPESALRAAPVWEPKVGEKARHTGGGFVPNRIVTVLAIDDDEVWLKTEDDYRFEAFIHDLREVK